MIVCICGGSGTGKTFEGSRLALTMGAVLLRTDDARAEVAHLPRHEQWSAASLLVAQRIVAASGDLVVEGVAVVRALRKALDLSPAAPCERLIILRGRRPEAGPELPGQRSQATGIETVLVEIGPRLRARGVVIEERGDPAPVLVAKVERAARGGNLLRPAFWKHGIG